MGASEVSKNRLSLGARRGRLARPHAGWRLSGASFVLALLASTVDLDCGADLATVASWIGTGGTARAAEPGLAPAPAAAPTASPSNAPTSAVPADPIPPKLLRMARHLIGQLDRNGDGRLQKGECAAAATASPPGAADASAATRAAGRATGLAAVLVEKWADIDRNGDGEISADELALRLAVYAKAHPFRMEAGDPAGPSPSTEGGPAAGGPVTASSAPFAVSKKRLPPDLPKWFLERDTDGDGQLSLSEYSPRATPTDVAAFRKLDLNGDGLLTPHEYLAATKPPGKKVAKKEKPDDAKVKRKSRSKSKDESKVDATVKPDAAKPDAAAKTDAAAK